MLEHHDPEKDPVLGVVQLGCPRLRIAFEEGKLSYGGIFHADAAAFAHEDGNGHRAWSSNGRETCRLCSLLREKLTTKLPRILEKAGQARSKRHWIQYDLTTSDFIYGRPRYRSDGSTWSAPNPYQNVDPSQLSWEDAYLKLFVCTGDWDMQPSEMVEFAVLYFQHLPRKAMEVPTDAPVVREPTDPTENVTRFVRRCIERCLPHTYCNIPFSKQRMTAKRYLEVDYDQVRLIETKNITNADQPYMVLSHRWGSDEKQARANLTKENYATFLKADPFSSLSEVFTDAVWFTYKMGVRYLWIDSLCIVQDSSDDWAHESGKMETIFANSYCSLSATGAPDGTSGLFNGAELATKDHCIHLLERPFAYNLARLGKSVPNGKPLAEFWSDCMMHHAWHRGFDPKLSFAPQGLIGTLQSGQVKPIFESPYSGIEVFDCAEWTELVTQAPLNKRGWVIQERVLAPRIVHFVGQKILWECRSMRCSYQNPDGLPAKSMPQDIKSIELNRGFLNAISRILTSQDPDNLPPAQTELITYTYWTKIVEVYSHTRITVDSDRLIALSGIARMMGKVFGDQYLVGLWESYLHWDLLWKRTEHLSGPQRPTRLTLPTWTWASLLAGVQPYWNNTHTSDDEEVLVKVGQVSIVPEDESYTGQIAFAQIQLRGRLLKASFSVGKSASSVVLTDEHGKVHAGDVAADDPAQEIDRWKDEARSRALVCLPVLKIDVHEAPHNPSETVECLLLRRTDGDAGEYVRVGRFTSQGRESADWLLREPIVTLEADDFEASRGGLFRVSIV